MASDTSSSAAAVSLVPPLAMTRSTWSSLAVSDWSLLRPESAADALDCGGLSGTVRTEDADDLPLLNRQVNSVENLGVLRRISGAPER